MFSLCIPTINRYDKFLNKNLKLYLENSLINEIIITDENGEDIKKIKNNFNNDKLVLIENETILGPFLNKMKCCKFAKNEWIALIDSDNFADSIYFDTSYNYINNNNLKKETIIAPSFAKENFDYREFQNNIINKKNLKYLFEKYRLFETFLNTGNFILNKFLIDNIYIPDKQSTIYKTPADVLLFNIMLFEQFDIDIHIVEKLHYDHTIHNDSVYIQTHNKYKTEIDTIYNRLKMLLN